MTRKRPVEHPVKSHIRSGVRVSKHKKGSGKRAEKVQRRLNRPSRSGRVSGFNVSLFFADKPRETVNVGESNYTAGVRAGLMKMDTPAIPERVQIRRRKR